MEIHLAYNIIQLDYRHSTQILLETNSSNITKQDKKPQLAGGNQLAIYKRGQGFELGTTENKFSQWPEYHSNLGLPECESDIVNTQPSCLLIKLIVTYGIHESDCQLDLKTPNLGEGM